MKKVMQPPTPTIEYSNQQMADDQFHYLDRVITVVEAAELYGKSPSVVRKACAEGKVLARKAGRDWLIDDFSAFYRWTIETPEWYAWNSSGFPIVDPPEDVKRLLLPGDYNPDDHEVIGRTDHRLLGKVFVLAD